MKILRSKPLNHFVCHRENLSALSVGVRFGGKRNKTILLQGTQYEDFCPNFSLQSTLLMFLTQIQYCV